MNVYAGVDIGGTYIKVALVSERGRIVSRALLDTNQKEGPQSAIRRTWVAIQSLVGERSVAGAGIGCAGLIDVRRGVIRSSPNLPAWQDAPLRRIAKRAFGVYTSIDNDANCAAWGEFSARRQGSVDDMVFITLGTGVGGGVVSGGRLVRGASNFGGEIGHMTVDPNGPKCRCGNRGCLEAYAGSYAIVRSARGMLRERRSRILSRQVERGERLSPRRIADAAHNGDAVARRAYKLAGEALGTAAASLVNIFNPKAVVIGGGIGAAFALLEPHVRRVIDARAFGAAASDVSLEASRLGNDAAVVGAALSARDDMNTP